MVETILARLMDVPMCFVNQLMHAKLKKGGIVIDIDKDPRPFPANKS
jgi:hypothetical protein